MKTIKQRLAAGETVQVFMMGSLANPKLIEVVGLMGGIHGVWIDQEHSAIPHHEFEIMMMACRAAGLDAFARVPPTDYGTIMRPMEAGAGGIMVAQIRTVAQVLQMVEWAKYPPIGVRGLFMANYEARYGLADARQHLEMANRERWLCIQIETPEAVDCVEGILAVPEVDALFVGPSDLAATLGVPGQVLHEKCVGALKRVAKATEAAGKSWGVLSRNPDHAALCRDLGCRLFSLMADMDLVHRGFHASKKMFGGFFE
ncbi:MAG: aldolase/citrate lyase family protein [Verrucomicrobiota bacterium]|jgi:4-hydroxy-2-oxoheptanedioate aldolase